MDFSNIKALLVDIEGTLHFKGKPIPGVVEALEDLRLRGIAMRFITNVDSKPITEIQQDLARMGLLVTEQEILSPVNVALDILQKDTSKRCYTLLSPELREMFAPYEVLNGEQADWVILGDMSQIGSYKSLDIAFRHLMNGANLLAFQGGRFFIRNDGYHLDTGAFVRLLEYGSGKIARILGKPEPSLFHLGIEQLGVSPTEIAVVGDDITTDIAGAKRIGVLSILVRTGKYIMPIMPGEWVEPDLIIDSFPDLLALQGAIRI
ncbi:hypothetical protein AR454_21730 [Bacillus mycoides]|uniref:HAD hydrolase-like protein n=1 Tax=Bacillus mycoides TaxID=1405 RepID=UPI001E577D06|nr:HAD hydrolase-like protein [Bacillus mycoides]MCD4644859.1 hypothetical protein [Bacillus mycoides]